MSGGAGNDTYYVNNAADLTIEQGVGGTDVVYSSINWTLGTNVENLMIIGSAIRAAGNALNNVIQGNSGDNIIRGGGGADTLTGAGGEDQFEIAATDSGRDTITDFAPGLDLFVLSGFGLDPIQEGYNFMIDAGPAGDYATLLYNTTTGILSYDEDGTGGVASREIALLSTKPTLTSADFFVY
jgi:Ca2+-binding RTX toxin-like protein